MACKECWMDCHITPKVALNTTPFILLCGQMNLGSTTEKYYVLVVGMRTGRCTSFEELKKVRGYNSWLPYFTQDIHGRFDHSSNEYRCGKESFRTNTLIINVRFRAHFRFLSYIKDVECFAIIGDDFSYLSVLKYLKKTPETLFKCFFNNCRKI